MKLVKNLSLVLLSAMLCVSSIYGQIKIKLTNPYLWKTPLFLFELPLFKQKVPTNKLLRIQPTQKIDQVAALKERVAFLEKKLTNEQNLDFTNQQIQSELADSTKERSRLTQENAQLKAELTASEIFNKELQSQMLKMTTDHQKALALAYAVRDKAQARSKELEAENVKLKTTLMAQCLEIQQMAQQAQDKADKLTQIKNRRK